MGSCGSTSSGFNRYKSDSISKVRIFIHRRWSKIFLKLIQIQWICHTHFRCVAQLREFLIWFSLFVGHRVFFFQRIKLVPKKYRSTMHHWITGVPSAWTDGVLLFGNVRSSHPQTQWCQRCSEAKLQGGNEGANGDGKRRRSGAWDETAKCFTRSCQAPDTTFVHGWNLCFSLWSASDIGGIEGGRSWSSCGRAGSNCFSSTGWWSTKWYWHADGRWIAQSYGGLCVQRQSQGADRLEKACCRISFTVWNGHHTTALKHQLVEDQGIWF